MDDALLREMLDLVRDQQAQNTRMMESMMAAHAAQAQVFQSWLEMFKPGAEPLRGTSADERALAREAREAAEWEPMQAQMLATLMNGEDLPNG